MAFGKPGKIGQGIGTVDDLIGGSANDYLEGGYRDENIWGQGGNDTLIGGVGNDNLYGGNGRDLLVGGKGLNWLEGGAGNDTLQGGSNTDIMVGGAGSDLLKGNGGIDILDGGSGNDTLLGGNGKDVFGFLGIFGHDVIKDTADGIVDNSVFLLYSFNDEEEGFDIDLEAIDTNNDELADALKVVVEGAGSATILGYFGNTEDLTAGNGVVNLVFDDIELSFSQVVALFES